MLSVYTGRYYGLTYIRCSDVPVFVESGRYRIGYGYGSDVRETNIVTDMFMSPFVLTGKRYIMKCNKKVLL